MFANFFKKSISKDSNEAENSSDFVVNSPTDSKFNNDDSTSKAVRDDLSPRLHRMSLPDTLTTFQVNQGRRNLTSILGRVANLLSNHNSNSYEDTNLKQYWMPDSISKECYECCVKFTTFRRKHHCRICGLIFCSNCCNHDIPGKIVGCSEELRVCAYCCKAMLEYLRSEDVKNILTSELKELRDDLSLKYGSQDTQSVKDSFRSGSEQNNTVRRKISTTYQDDFIAMPATQRDRAFTSLNELVEDLLYVEPTLELATHCAYGVYYPSSFLGCQLIDFLIAKKKTTSRVHSKAIGQVLLDAKYIENVLERCENFIDGPVLYRFTPISTFDVNQLISDRSSIYSTIKEDNKDSSLNADDCSTQSVFHMDVNLRAQSVAISKHSVESSNTQVHNVKQQSQVADMNLEDVREFVKRLNSVSPVRSISWKWNSDFSRHHSRVESSNDYEQFNAIFRRHIEAFAKRLFDFENLHISWASVILRLIGKAIDSTRVDLQKADTLDICNFIRIKKITGGTTQQSHLIRGVAFGKNVIHREMATKLENPKILIIRCDVAYQRGKDRFMSLEPVLMQENSYLQHAVARIVELNPDIVIVRHSISNIALRLLKNAKISVVVNVKMCVLERIARYTNGDIITSIDAYLRNTRLGTCKSFEVKRFVMANGSIKSLMILDGCEGLDCTIVLRGGAKNELKKVKKICDLLSIAIYNAKWEMAFLLDEFARPPVLADVEFLSEKNDLENRDAARDEVNNKFFKSNSTNFENTKILEIKEREIVSDRSDPLTNITTASPEVGDNNPILTLSEIPLNNAFQRAMDDVMLSISPFIKFKIPYLESQKGKNCPLRRYFSQDIYRSVLLGNMKEGNRSETKMIPEPKQVCPAEKINFINAKLVSSESDNQIQTTLALYRAKAGPKKVKYHPPESILKPDRILENDHELKDSFDASEHQKFSFLFSCFSDKSNNAPEFCVSPWIVTINFYSENDMSLENFLEKYCFDEIYNCASETCGRLMIDHERRFAHDDACVKLILINVATLGPNRDIYAWSRCSVCQYATKVSVLSSSSRALSFAKYLELRFLAGKYAYRLADENACHHSLHRDFAQYFCQNNIVARFQYSNISVREICLPPSTITIKPATLNVEAIKEEVNRHLRISEELFDSIREKFSSIEVEEKYMRAMKRHLDIQRNAFKFKMAEINDMLRSPTFTEKNSSNASILKDVWNLEDSLVLLKKSIAEAFANWNSLFANSNLLSKKEAVGKTKSAKSSSTDLQESIPIDQVNNSVFDESNENNTPSKDVSEPKNPTKSSALEVQDVSTEESPSTSNALSEKLTFKFFSQLFQSSSQTANSTGISLPNPSNTDEHYLLSSSCSIPIVVCKNEPSSIIAYALSTYQYQMATKCESTESSADIKGDVADDGKPGGKSIAQNHVEVQFGDDSTTFTVQVYFAEQFRKLRSVVFPDGEEAFIRSLSSCISWAAHGGKSGLTFCKTKDDRFILKEMNRFEVESFLEFAAKYFDFVDSRYKMQKPTLLGKIVGVYKVKYKSTSSTSATGGTVSNLLLMENLFYERDISWKYDLKGSVRNRLVNTDSTVGGDKETVLLDENLIITTKENPLYIHAHSKEVLMRGITDDVNFLASQSVMDYSLLVGVDKTNNELVVGIIDYIRTFTWDKKLENMVKKSILGGQKKLPTIVPPHEYKNRFISAMLKYFLAVPNHWFDHLVSRK